MASSPLIFDVFHRLELTPGEAVVIRLLPSLPLYVRIPDGDSRLGRVCASYVFRMNLYHAWYICIGHPLRGPSSRRGVSSGFFIGGQSAGTIGLC